MLKKVIFGLFALGLFVFLALQFVPYGRNHTNPPAIAEPNWDSPRTRAYFFRACADCHSNETVWPWYSHIAPISWLIQRDVDRGRAALNVSEWGVQRNEGEDAAELVQSGEMPLPIYLPLHPEARLSPQEKQAFIQGLVATFGGESGKPSSEVEGGEEEEE
ncbi:MAG: heme-binding domain-containing protein [Anaerolineales bacterium]|nr:heme-binding domain-containing protein [Anaerolineales bacterium]